MSTLFNNHWHENPLATPPIHQMIDTSSHNTGSYRDSSISSFTSNQSSSDNDFPVPSNAKTTYVLPEAMGKDIISKHSRIRASLYLDSNVHVAGGSVKGRLELVCMSEKLKIGKILVELIGFEDIVDKGNSKSNATQHKVFMVKPFFIQDTDLPPTEAVDMTSKPDGDGHWNAIKGRNVFEFDISANEELPSSFMSRWASVRYIVACSVHIKIPSTARKQILKIHRETTLVETVPEHLQYSVPAQGFASQQLFMGGKNVLGLECRVHKTLWNSGSPIYVEAILRNETKKKVVAIKSVLIRRLNTFSRQEDKLHPVVFAKKVVQEVRVDKNSWGGVERGQERRIVLEIPVPVDIRTISKAELVDVTYAVQVCVSATLSPDTVVEIPVKIVHPLSMNRPPYLMHKTPKTLDIMRHNRASRVSDGAFDRERSHKKVKEPVSTEPSVVASAPYLHEEELIEEIIDEPLPECPRKNIGNWTSTATVFESTPTMILMDRSNEPKEADAEIHTGNGNPTTFTLPRKPNQDFSHPLGSKRMRPPPPPMSHSKPAWARNKPPDSSNSTNCIPVNVPLLTPSPVSMAQHKESEEKESHALPPPDVKITPSPAKVASLSRQSSLAIPPIAARNHDYQDDAHSSLWSGQCTDGESSSQLQKNLSGDGSESSLTQPIERPDWPSNETLEDSSDKIQEQGSGVVNEGEDEISIAKRLNTMFSGFLQESNKTEYPVHQQPVTVAAVL